MGLRAPALSLSLDQCARAPSSGTTPTQITLFLYDIFIDWSLVHGVSFYRVLQTSG